MSQYLFPDASVEKSPENSKDKTAQANSCGKTEQDKNSDYVGYVSPFATFTLFLKDLVMHVLNRNVTCDIHCNFYEQ